MVVKYTFSTVKQYMDAWLTTLKFYFFDHVRWDILHGFKITT